MPDDVDQETAVDMRVILFNCGGEGKEDGDKWSQLLQTAATVKPTAIMLNETKHLGMNAEGLKKYFPNHHIWVSPGTTKSKGVAIAMAPNLGVHHPVSLV
jgi:hypothetical protein